jgi:hypothetical protein
LNPFHKPFVTSIIYLIPLIIGFGIYPIIIPVLILTFFTLINVDANPYWTNMRPAWSKKGIPAFFCAFSSICILLSQL